MNLSNGKKLTNRQFEVLSYLAQGLSNKQIAYQMGVSEATVKLHINALLRAVEANNRTQAVIKAQKMGVIQ
jgi:DNA-binding NarL/FixJ family response regulator